MKRLILFIAIISAYGLQAQIDAGSVMGIPSGTTAEINAITTAAIGSCAFNTDDEAIYWYTSSGWVRATDSQTLSLNTNTLAISNGNNVNLSGYLDNTDNQNLTGATLNGSNELQIDIQNGNSVTVDLSSLADTSQNLATDDLTQDAETRTYDMNGEDLNFTNGSFGVGTTNPAGTFEGRSSSDQNAFYFVQQNGTTGEKDVFTIEDQDVGGGGQDESSVLKVLKSGNINASDNGFSLIELASTGTDSGADEYWISGRKTDEGAPLWGVDITDNDFWSEGGIVLGVTGADGGTYSGGNFIVESDGDTGVGTTTPDARLDVEGGTVRFSDYGSNAQTGTATTLLGIEADGDIVEVNSLKSSRIFYPPSIAIDASTTGNNRTIDLYQQYLDQYGGSASNYMASTGAPAIPTYARTELYYYVTVADPAVLNIDSIDANGVMQYDVVGTPADYNSLINVVFVVQ